MDLSARQGRAMWPFDSRARAGGSDSICMGQVKREGICTSTKKHGDGRPYRGAWGGIAGLLRARHATVTGGLEELFLLGLVYS